MGRNLFEINESMLNLLEYGVDDTTGEVIESQEEFDKLYDAIALELDTKVDNTNCLIKMLNGEVDVIDKEIERLQKEKKSRIKKVEWLTNRINSLIHSQFTDELGNLDTEKLGKFKWELNHSKISYRKSESVEIDDLSLIAKKFLKKEITYKPNRVDIKTAIANGEKIKGAHIEKKYNIQIK